MKPKAAAAATTTNGRPSTNHRTKTINLGLEKSAAPKPKPAPEVAKSRNAASRAQDRKTFEAKMGSSDKKEERFLYQTTAEGPDRKTTSKKRPTKQPSVVTKKVVESSAGAINCEKLRKLKVSLMGVDAVPGYSRNAIPVKTSVRDLGKEKVSAAVIHPRKTQQTYGGSKRAYVASLLQPSASMKK